MRAVSWHDNVGVSSLVSSERKPRRRADSGRHPAGFVAKLGSAKCGWLTESRSARIPTSRSRHRAGVVGEPSCPIAGAAYADLKVAGPHAVERLVLAGSRAGGLPEVTRRLVGWCWRQWVSGRRSRRTESRRRSTRPSREVFAAKIRRMAFGVLGRKASWAAARRRRAARGCWAYRHGRRRCVFGLAAGPA